MKVCIDNEWYELSKWAPSHPGGEEIIGKFANQDATDAFMSLHSKDALMRLKRMHPLETKENVPVVDKLDQAYRDFRARLQKEGWFERDMYNEMKNLLPILGMMAWGTYHSYTNPVMATIALSVAMQQAGWVGHDYTHARESGFCANLAPFMSSGINGLDRGWWSNKHNTHHVLTNQVGLDPDIHNEPLLFSFVPPPALDKHYRKYQPYYAPILYCFLFISWRIQSFKFALGQKRYQDLLFKFLPGYIWLACLPLGVATASMLLSGFLVAIVVTLSHESEEFSFDRQTSFVKMQFNGTRDIACPDPITEYLCGGMQYQLIHHLFPTMPRYKYPAMVKEVKQFAADTGLKYNSSGVFEMLAIHFKTMKRNALGTKVNPGAENFSGWTDLEPFPLPRSL